MFCLRRTFLISLGIAFLLMSAHRCPAPIQEIPETPTPAPKIGFAAESIQKKPKKVSQPETKAKATPKYGTAVATPRFAGTWKGILHGAANGAAVTIVVSPAEDLAVIRGLPLWGDRQGQATVHGNTLSWPFMAESWTMIISSDGRTASVTGHHWPAGASSGIFEKVQ